MNYFLLSLAVAFNAAGYTAFKAIAARPHDLVWFGVFVAGLGFGAINVYCFTLALRELRLAIAYPIFAGGSIAIISAVAALYFGERFTLVNLFGSVLVLGGIVALSQ